MDYDFLSYNNSSLKNMQFYRQNLPNISKKDGLIKISTKEEFIIVGDIEESIFLILIEYTFIPVWLLDQMLSNNIVNKDLKDTINSWLNIGIIWIDRNIAGEFVRPTYLLYEILNQKNNKFVKIPFNMLTKYITEQNIVFETLVGLDNCINNTLKSVFIEKHSPFGLDVKSNGTNIVYNNQLTTPKALILSGYENIDNIHKLTLKSYKDKTSYEFKDFRAWTVIKKVGDFKNINKDFKLHLPNLVIPSINKNNIAIEIELANRGVKHYVNVLEMYKNNIIYKNILFLCSSFTICSNIRSAYDIVKKEEEITENIYLLDLNVPSPL